MNRIYKLIWNPQLRALVVASELANGHGRVSAQTTPLTPRLAVLSAACGMALMATAFGAHAQQAELADLQNLVARYSQPVEDISALVARASGNAQATASVALAPASIDASARVAVSAQVAGDIAPAPALPVIRKVRHAGLSVTPAVQVQTVASALASAAVGTVGVQPATGSLSNTLASVSESLAASGSGQASAPAGRLLAVLRPRDPAIGNRDNLLRTGLVSTVGLVEDGAGKLLDKTHLGGVSAGLLDVAGTKVATVGHVGAHLVGGLTGSASLAGTVSGVGGALDGGLNAIGGQVDATNLAGVVGAVGGTAHNAGVELVGGVSATLGGLTGNAAGLSGATGVVGGLTAGVGNGLTATVGQLTGNPSPSPMLTAPGGAPSGISLSGGLTTVVGTVEHTTGQVLGASHLGSVTVGVLDGVGSLVAGVGNLAGTLVGGLSGSAALAGTVGGVTGALDVGLGAIGSNLEQGNLAGVVSAVGGSVHNVTGELLAGGSATVGGLTGTVNPLGGVGSVVGGVTAGLSNGLAGTVGQLTGNPAPSGVIVSPNAPPATYPSGLQPGDPRRVPAGSRTSGLIVGTGGAVGTLGSVIGPTLQNLLGGDGYIRNGDTTINSANIVQAYSVTNVLGLPVVNLSPVGTLLDGLGGVSTGSNSHLTVLGGATSDSYIFNINNGDPNGLLGLVLPDRAPDWAGTCLNVLGLVSTDCWAVNAAQDYQVLIGDGAYANGSKEVVIGTNARHQLPLADANDVFAGNGVNDPTNPTGVPTADYDARQGHSVVIGDSAIGTANGQTLLGAGATSDKANSVALGFKSKATRGGQDNYSAYGLAATQTSIGEVAVGSAGRERQITHVAAGSGDTDAVNVAQLRSAIDNVSVGSNPFAVLYADNGAGAPDYTRITLGNGGAATTISNLAAGEVSAVSSEAVNGAQLHGTADSLATALGGNAAVNADGTVSAPTYTLTSVAADGSTSTGDYNDVGSAFDAMGQSITNINTTVANGLAGAVRYDTDSSGAVDFSQVTLGDGNGQTRLTNVAVGSVAAGSSDAMTGGQLHGNASSVAAHFGGGAAVAADGSLSGPNYTIDTVDANGNLIAGSYSDVGSAFDAVGQSIRNIFNNGTAAIDPLAVRYLADAQGNPSNLLRLTGSGSGAVTITNLAAAQVVAGSSDAVNGDQLAATNAALSSYLGGTTSFNGSSNVWVGPTFALTTVAADGTLSTSTFNDVTAAFNSVSQSLTNISNVPPGAPSTTPSPYLDVNSSGAPALATGSEAIALGSSASSEGQAAVAIGQNSSASAANSVALGADAVADRANTVSVGSAGNERQVTNVADGSQATDAVNVRQLQASQQGTVRYDQNTDGSTNYNSITLGQSSSGPALVRNVAAGVNSTDAVNVGQMQAGLDQVKDWSRNYTDDRFNAVGRDLRDIDNRASAGIASAMAMAGLPQPYEAGRSMASFAASSFNGEGSIAVGISGVSEGGRWIYKLSGSANTRGDGGVTVGAGIQW